MYSKIVIVGYLGRDPELRYLPDGTAVGDMSVAVSDKYKNKAGQMVERTTWFKVSVWGAQAENVHQYLSKGRPVLVEGTLQADDSGNPRIWTDKNGNARASFEVKAHAVKFLPSGGGNGAGAQQDDDDDDPF